MQKDSRPGTQHPLALAGAVRKAAFTLSETGGQMSRRGAPVTLGPGTASGTEVGRAARGQPEQGDRGVSVFTVRVWWGVLAGATGSSVWT